MLKYYSEISLIENSNSSSCTSGLNEVSFQSFRWVFEDDRDDNFLPRALIDNPKIIELKTQCNGWSLSLFDSEENAKNRLVEICKNKPNLYKRLGTHIAKGFLSKNDGLASEIDTKGHFELFEYKDVTLKSKFDVVLNVIDEYANK